MNSDSLPVNEFGKNISMGPFMKSTDSVSAAPVLPRIGINANWLSRVTSLQRQSLFQLAVDDASFLAGIGYQAAELTVAHCDPFIDEVDEPFWQDLGDAVRAEGIVPVSVHGPYYPTLDRDFEPAAARLVLHARAARALGVRAFVVHPVFHSHLHVTDIMRKALAWDQRISFAISDALGDNRTVLAIENTPHHSFGYLEALLHSVERDNVGMCFDTGHYHVRPENTLEATWRRFADRVVHLHLSDNDGLSDQHLPIGLGTFDWSAFFELVDFQKVSNCIMLELSAPIHAQAGDVAVDQTQRLYVDALASTRQLLGRTLKAKASSERSSS